MGAVLIVESSGFLCRLVGSSLTRADLAFVGARSFQAAVDAIQKETPGLILLDLDLPGKLDIEKACKLIKNVPRCRDVPILLISSRDEGMDDKVARTGAIGFFRKPFSPTMFMEWLEKQTEIKQSIRSASEPPDEVKPKKKSKGKRKAATTTEAASEAESETVSDAAP